MGLGQPEELIPILGRHLGGLTLEEPGLDLAHQLVDNLALARGREPRGKGHQLDILEDAILLPKIHRDRDILLETPGPRGPGPVPHPDLGPPEKPRGGKDFPRDSPPERTNLSARSLNSR